MPKKPTSKRAPKRVPEKTKTRTQERPRDRADKAKGSEILGIVCKYLAHAGPALAGEDESFDSWIKAWLTGEGGARQGLAVAVFLAGAMTKVKDAEARFGKEDARSLRALARAEALLLADAARGIDPKKTYRIKRQKVVGEELTTLGEALKGLSAALEKLKGRARRP